MRRNKGKTRRAKRGYTEGESGFVEGRLSRWEIIGVRKGLKWGGEKRKPGGLGRGRK